MRGGPLTCVSYPSLRPTKRARGRAHGGGAVGACRVAEQSTRKPRCATASLVSSTLEFFSRLIHARELIQWGGYPAIMAVIFAETGLLVGFFLPGDSLLVTAGVLVEGNLLNPLGLD